MTLVALMSSLRCLRDICIAAQTAGQQAVHISSELKPRRQNRLERAARTLTEQPDTVGGLYDILGRITSPWGRTPWVLPLKWRR